MGAPWNGPRSAAPAQPSSADAMVRGPGRTPPGLAREALAAGGTPAGTIVRLVQERLPQKTLMTRQCSVGCVLYVWLD